MINYKEMPKGVMNINLIQIFSTFGFGVLLGTLNLYLQRQGMPIAAVNTLTASFFALNFLLHLLGGVVGGKYLSYRTLFATSLILQIAGLLLIAAGSLNIILTGMALFLTGSGLNVSCINLMLTQLFKQNDLRRRQAFSVNYSCMNIGFILSFLIANYFQEYGAYRFIFSIAAICVLVAFIFHIFAWQHVKDRDTFYAKEYSTKIARWFTGPGAVIICFFITFYLMHHAFIASILIYVAFIIALVYMIYLASQQTPQYRDKIIAYIFLTAACMVFAFVQGLQATSLQNFVHYNTNQNLLGIHIGPSGFNMFESLGVIIFGFILAKAMRKRQKQKRPYEIPYLITKGLSFNIIAFLMIPVGIITANFLGASQVQLFFPILLLIFVAAAEIHVNATNYSMAGELGKQEHHGIFTGYLFMNIAVGVNFSGFFSNIILGKYVTLTDVASSQTNPMYLKTFFVLSAIAAIITLFYFFMGKKLKRLLSS